jgi:Holliday junction DNA helicase RuvA
MIATLRGTVHKMDIGEVIVDVQGVGYKVTVPVDVWDGLQEAEQTMLWVSTYVREDRFDLYGFRDRAGRTMFDGVKKQIHFQLVKSTSFKSGNVLLEYERGT